MSQHPLEAANSTRDAHTSSNALIGPIWTGVNTSSFIQPNASDALLHVSRIKDKVSGLLRLNLGSRRLVEVSSILPLAMWEFLGDMLANRQAHDNCITSHC
jgi:hypothetical protein